MSFTIICEDCGSTECEVRAGINLYDQGKAVIECKSCGYIEEWYEQ